MKFLFFALFLGVFALIFLGMNAIIKKLAYPRDKRYLHCRVIFAVFAAEVIGANVYTETYSLLAVDKIINASFMQNFFAVVLPNRAYELLYMILSLLGINILITLLIILVNILIKIIFKFRTRYWDYSEFYGFEKVLHLPWIITKHVYTDENGKPELTERGFVFGLWAKGLKWSFLILAVFELLVMAVSVFWGGEEWNAMLLNAARAWYLLPMAGFLLFEQIQFFLEGTYEESITTFGSEDISERLDGSIPVLMALYHELFESSGALIYSDFDSNGSGTSDGLLSNSPGNRQISDCTQPEVFEVISSQLKFCGVVQNENYLNAIVSLLNGSSINVCDCIEGEFFPYLCAYLSFHLSQGKTAVVLCRDHSGAERLCEVLNHQMKKINSLYSVWNICTTDGLRDNRYINILVCSGDEFANTHVIEKRPDFAGNLFCVVIAGGYHIFSQDSIHTELIANTIRKIDRELRYIMLTEEDNDTLRTTMEIFTKQNMVPVNNSVKLPNTGIMIWKEESSYRLQRFLNIGANPLSPYMGPFLPLALVAAKYDLPAINLITDPVCPTCSYNDVLQMNAKETQKYLTKFVNLTSVIRCDINDALAPQDISMLIAYDRDFNFYNTMWKWLKYGGKDSTLLHIISPPYMLREFLAAGFGEKQLYLKNNEFSAFVPYSLGMKNSRMAVMLVSLCDTGMTEDELMEIVKRYEWPYETVEALLRDCLKILLLDDEVHNIYECFHFCENSIFVEERDTFESSTLITITDETIRSRLYERIRYACLVQKDNQQKTLPILEDNIFNYYLRDQVAVFDEHTYVISAVKNGRIYAEQELVREMFSYFPISEFIFGDNYHIKDPCVDTDYMDINLCSSTVTRRIYGYWANNRGNNFAEGSVIQINDLRDENLEPLSVTHHKSSILEINLKRSDLGAVPENTVLLMCYMLSELFKTLFPATYQNLFAVTERDPDRLIDDTLRLGTANGIENTIRSFIPFTVQNRKSNEEFVTLYIVEFSSVEFGMIQILKNRIRNIFVMMREYLRWYLGEPEGNELRGSYLNFGFEQIPDCLAAEDLLGFCARAVPLVEEPAFEQFEETLDAGNCCTFCGRVSLFMTEMDDGRKMCSYCKDHQLLQKDEIRDLYMETVKYMQDGYRINLPKRIRVRFQSARTIRNMAGESTDGRILGFYSSAQRQLWLEARGPRIAMQSTLIHELTHAWQYNELDLKALKAKLPGPDKEKALLEVLEGHAVYSEIVTLRHKNETEYVDRMEKLTLLRDDEYGRGYRFISEVFREIIADKGSMNPYELMKYWVDTLINGGGGTDS